MLSIYLGIILIKPMLAFMIPHFLLSYVDNERTCIYFLCFLKESEINKWNKMKWNEIFQFTFQKEHKM